MMARFMSEIAAFVSQLMALCWKSGSRLKSSTAQLTPPPPPTWQSGATCLALSGMAVSCAATAALTPPLVGYM